MDLNGLGSKRTGPARFNITNKHVQNFVSSCFMDLRRFENPYLNQVEMVSDCNSIYKYNFKYAGMALLNSNSSSDI